jgi:hypothetical protein
MGSFTLSDGSINFPIRTSHPSPPTTGRVKRYIYNDGVSSTPYYMAEDGIPIVEDGTLDHLELSNIGTNTHDQIDTHISATNNPHSVTKTQVGLSNVDNTSDVNKPISTATQTALDLKANNTTVDNHINNSNNPHSTTKAHVGLSNVPNIDATQRANHSGTQLSSTISDFSNSVRSTLLTGLSTATNAVISASDTILVALGKIQAQINAMVFGRQAEDFLDTTQVNFSGGISLIKTYTTQVNPVGRYRIGMMIQTEPSSNNSNDFFELRVNGTLISLRQEDESKDTGGDIRRTYYLLGYYNHTSVATFDVQAWGGNEGGTTELNGAITEVWRVS